MVTLPTPESGWLRSINKTAMGEPSCELAGRVAVGEAGPVVGGAGEEAEDDEFFCSSAAQATDSVVELGASLVSMRLRR